MGQDEKMDWPGSWSAQIGERIRTLRSSAGMSAQKVSDRCSEVGFPIPRSTIANIESGRKEALPLHEISVIAAALRVPPAALLFPVDEDSDVEVLPGQPRPPFAAWTWFTEANIGFDVLNSALWDSSPAHTDFLEILQANVQLRRHEANWQIMQGVIQKMEAISDDEAMTAAIGQTRARQRAEAKDAGPFLKKLLSKGLPVPELPEKFEQEVRDLLEGGGHA